MSLLRRVIQFVQQVMGEDAYDRYCRHLRATGSTTPPPTPQQFYLESLERRYKGVSRCC